MFELGRGRSRRFYRGGEASSPFDLSAGNEELQLAQLAIRTGPVGTAYAALQLSTGEVLLRTTTNFGVSWGQPVSIGMATNQTSGVSLQSFNDEVFIGYQALNAVTVASSRNRGMSFSSVTVPTTNAFFDLVYDVRQGTLAIADASPSFEVLLSNDHGATFGPAAHPPGQQFFSDWALGNGELFAVGINIGAIGNSSLMYVIPTSAPSTSTPIGTLPLVHVALSRAVTADDVGNAYVSSQVDTNGVRLDRLPFGSISFDPPRVLTATGTAPNAAPLPGGQGVVVIYTESGSQVWATVQAYSNTI